MKSLFRILLPALLAVPTLFAQVSGHIKGVVVDATGSSVADARVTLILTGGTGAAADTRSSREGIFDIIARPAEYNLEIEAPGFAKQSLKGLRVETARELDLGPVRMEVSTTSQTVEVTASALTLDSATAEVSTTVTQEQIINLPTLNRQITNLLNTQAGVSQNNRTVTVINGMRPSYSVMMVDGVMVQDTVRTNNLDYIPNRITVGQTAEITISTTNAGPTLGGGSSSIVITTPSGTNRLKGAAWWYNRNSAFASNDWFNNRNGIARPQLNLNQPGFQIGGPIKKDKLFFFGGYEIYRLKRQSPKTNTILTPTARQGILQYPVGGAIQQFNVLTAQRVAPSPFVKTLLDQIPATGNNNAIGDGLNTTGFTFNRRANTTRDNVTAKIDYSLSTRHAFAGSYNWNRDVIDRNDGTFYTVVPPTYNDNKSKLLSLSWRWNPGPTLTNELRGGLNYQTGPFKVTQPRSDYYLTGLLFSTPIQTTELGEGRNINQYNLQNNTQWIHGKHSVSFGYQLSTVRTDSYNYNGDVFPRYTVGISAASPYGFALGDIPGANAAFTGTGNSILQTIAGLISSGTQGFNATGRSSGFVPGAPAVQKQRFDQHAFYAVDTFRIRPRLTATIGVRFDYFAPVDETSGLAIAPKPINNSGPVTLLSNASLDFAGTTNGAPFYKKDWNNFAPNVALAWDPFGKGKTIVRAGFNIAFVNDNHLNSVYNTFSVNNGLTSSRGVNNLIATADRVPSIPAPPFQIPTTTLDQFNLSPGAPPVEGIVDPNLATPYVEQWVFSIQHEVKGWRLEGRYVGNHGVKMFRGVDINQVNIRQGDFVEDFTRGRNNGFAAVNSGRAFSPAYNPAVPGSQPLTFLSTLPPAALTNATLLTNFRTGEIGTYAQNVQSLFPFPALGRSFFPNPYLLYAVMMTNRSISNYNGLQLEATRRIRSGMQIQVNYTFSKALTDANNFRGLDPQIDNASPRVEKARADFDLTHALKFNHYYPLPIGTGHRFKSPVKALNQVVDGWAVSGFGVVQTGSPVSILSARGTLNRGSRSGQNTVDSTFNLAQLHQATGLFMTGNGPYWLNPANIGPDTRGVAADGSPAFSGQLFTNPLPGTQGTLQKRLLDGPRFRNYNLSVIKAFKVRENLSLDFHADFFNVFNHANFYLGDQTINNTAFGRITTQNTSNDGVGPRVIQYGLYLRF